MIYCKLKKRGDTSAIYLFGKTVGDITGEAEFYSSLAQPSVLKQPQNGTVPDRWLAMVAVKYQEQFEKGDFPEKISYER